jgi:hypothetical protein
MLGSLGFRKPSRHTQRGSARICMAQRCTASARRLSLWSASFSCMNVGTNSFQKRGSASQHLSVHGAAPRKGWSHLVIAALSCFLASLLVSPAATSAMVREKTRGPRQSQATGSPLHTPSPVNGSMLYKRTAPKAGQRTPSGCRVNQEGSRILPIRGSVATLVSC